MPAPSPTAGEDHRPDPAPLAVLYRDAHLIAVDKPAGLLVHRSPIDRHETRFALQLVRDQIGQRVYPVHRLDKPTSGVLLLALHPEAAQLLTAAFTAGQVRKTYLAVVRGYTDEAGTIDHPLADMDPWHGRPGGDAEPPRKPAMTDYRRLAVAELPYAVDRYAASRYSLVEIAPRTGRQHQIRRHLKHIAHPIIGDTTHGKGRHNRLFKTLFGSERLLLAAVALGFRHPYGGQGITISAPLDPVMDGVLKQLGWAEAVSGIWTGSTARG